MTLVAEFGLSWADTSALTLAEWNQLIDWAVERARHREQQNRR